MAPMFIVIVQRLTIFFQGICEHYELNWREYGSKMPKDAKEWVKKNFPRLVGVDDSHSYGL